MTVLKETQRAALENSGCEVRTDRMTRCLYAVDASIYRVEPAAVAFPGSAREAADLLRAAADSGVEVTPRGAGTGLAGGALGAGLVVDFARHNCRISNLDLEAGTVRVGAGVVLDQLNTFLAPHGLWFGPDVATSSRATLGGMIANNSSGAHAPVYRTTANHLEALEVVLSDGTVAAIGSGDDGLPEIRETADRLVAANAAEIRKRLPEGLVKRWPGYGLDRALRAPGDLTQLVAGSEGTLAGISSAVLRVVPLPSRRSLGVIFFASVEEALQATVEIADLDAAAIEHLDDVVFDQTRGQRAFRAARDFLRLDQEPCKAMLLVEFFEDDGGRLAELQRRGLGLRATACTTAAEAELVWGMRRAGLSLVTSRKGPAKPVPGIEDVCVLPERLPEYVAGLRRILDPLGLEASFYGHAASGELHVRPVLDLHLTEDIEKLRLVADQVSDLCQLFKGSLAAEHGVGMARASYLEAHLGPELIEAGLVLKSLFDPSGTMNPGKVFGDGRFRIDRNLRLGAGSEIVLPFAEAFQWSGRDDGFVANLEQCNGCGGCRKAAPTMCPTFAATGDEALSTRGRANIVRAALEGRFEGRSLESAELDEVLGTCLACKACVTECPSNVDMARLKLELRHARHRNDGIPLTDRMIASADLLGRVGTMFSGFANWMLRNRLARRLLQLVSGIHAEAPIPPFAKHRFDAWFRGRPAPGSGRGRGRVILWDDTWVRYHEPDIGRAGLAVLEAAGFEVALATGRKCCGRPAASRGLLDVVRRSAEHNVRLLAKSEDPIIFLEPSCWSMFRDEYLQFGIEGAKEVAERAVLFEDFIGALLEREPDALPFTRDPGTVAIHGHCHAKALSDAPGIVGLFERLPGGSPQWLETGCCGMAGAFGMLNDHRDLSHQVAAPLVRMIDGLPNGARVVASGTSCRHQIGDLTAARPLHVAELLAECLEGSSE
jgi:FAD/FMN-containing dehydrogenase/Fe-S oxidoreductase